ncbi:MAG: hypothetical protein BWY93_00463 [Euryarchaeota archaeon ADurb.BinA087]|nr:MAG: hypothetical protein BWY93_00463 [Euryarchaeota archaeon ADurb.BinA087]
MLDHGDPGTGCNKGCCRADIEGPGTIPSGPTGIHEPSVDLRVDGQGMAEQHPDKARDLLRRLPLHVKGCDQRGDLCPASLPGGNDLHDCRCLVGIQRFSICKTGKKCLHHTPPRDSSRKFFTRILPTGVMMLSG